MLYSNKKFLSTLTKHIESLGGFLFFLLDNESLIWFSGQELFRPVVDNSACSWNILDRNRGSSLEDGVWVLVKRVKLTLWCWQDGNQLERSSPEASLGFQKLSSKCSRISGALFTCVLHTLTYQDANYIFCFIQKFCFHSNFSSDKSGIAILPLSFFLPVEF